MKVQCRHFPLEPSIQPILYQLLPRRNHETEILVLGCQGMYDGCSKWLTTFADCFVQVIAHELSNSLCSLRLSNVYDLSTVSRPRRHNLIDMVRNSLEENLSSQVRQAKPPTAAGHRLWLSLSSYRFHQNDCGSPLSFRYAPKKVFANKKSHINRPSGHRPHNRDPVQRRRL